MVRIHQAEGSLSRSGLALERGHRALAISLPGGASLAEESVEDEAFLACLELGHWVQGTVPGPQVGECRDHLLEMITRAEWGASDAPEISRVDELKGKTISGRYQLEDVVGEGGYGTVFTATDQINDADVVVKILHPGLSRQRHIAQSFFNEARACMSLESPFIVKMTDFGHSQEGLLFCVMEQLVGRSLAELPRELCSVEVLISVCLDVLRALEVVHASDLVHRDIKPANIFVVRGASGAARGRLIDFGIALHQLDPAPIQERGEIVGSAAYISPEQLTGAPAGPSADLYAVGMVFYRCLVGQIPFPNLDALPQLMRRSQVDIPALEDSVSMSLPPGLGSLVDRALSRELSQRPASAREFAEELKLIQRGGDPRSASDSRGLPLEPA